MNMIRIYDKIEEYLIVICLLSMTLINFGNVFSRYLLKASWSFSEELLIIMFIWCVMLATAIAYKRSEHLGLPLIVEKLPQGLRRICIIFSGSMSALLVVVLAISGYHMVMNQITFNQTTAVLGLPEWIPGASVPIGAIFIFIRVIQSTILEVAKPKEEHLT